MTGLSTTRKFRRVDLRQLQECVVPGTTNTYQPVDHAWLYREVASELDNRGYQVASRDLRISGSGDEFFGILRLKSSPNSNAPWDLSLGLRNTNNKRASVGVFLGTNVWVCDNLQFSAEHTFLRKHHAGTYDVLRKGIYRICTELGHYRIKQGNFVARLQEWSVTPAMRDHLLVNLLRANAVKANEILPIINETINPSVNNEECDRNSGWGLYNAVTFIGKGGFERNPETAATRSVGINQVFQNAFLATAR